MINFTDIVSQYPTPLQPYKRNILREYLQYKMLALIFSTKIGTKLSFIGGTALRIAHNNNRFSEDIDFDNFQLTPKDFEILINNLAKSLKTEGFKVETRNVFKGAFRSYVRFPNLLFQLGLTQIEEEKILIQVDTASQGFSYEPETIIINKFEVFNPIRITPIDILLSQKIYAAITRKTAKGRDYYDIVFLLSKTKPNFQFLSQKLNVKSGVQLRNLILDKAKTLNFDDLARDVQSFLFYPQDKQKVQLFPDYIKKVDFE